MTARTVQDEMGFAGEITPNLAQMIECVQREIRYRKNVYPRRVLAKRMSRELMDQQIRLMEAVLANLEAQR